MKCIGENLIRLEMGKGQVWEGEEATIGMSRSLVWKYVGKMSQGKLSEVVQPAKMSDRIFQGKAQTLYTNR